MQYAEVTSRLKVLLDGGADVAILSGGKTPLHLAVQENADILAALVEAGADVEARNDAGQTPLHSAAFNSSRTAAMRALLHLGANVHATSNLGSTPLHIACQQGLLDGADLLLGWGGDETTLDKDRRTPRWQDKDCRSCRGGLPKTRTSVQAAGVCSAG